MKISQKLKKWLYFYILNHHKLGLDSLSIKFENQVWSKQSRVFVQRSGFFGFHWASENGRSNSASSPHRVVLSNVLGGRASLQRHPNTQPLAAADRGRAGRRAIEEMAEVVVDPRLEHPIGARGSHAVEVELHRCEILFPGRHVVRIYRMR